ncbi:MAG: hypothetical protein ACNA7V_14330 [Bacteroidales bacterium]
MAILYSIAMFQMIVVVILGVCLLFSSKGPFSRLVVLGAYLFMSLIAFTGYTSNLALPYEADELQFIYMGCAAAILLPLVFITKSAKYVFLGLMGFLVYSIFKKQL